MNAIISKLVNRASDLADVEPVSAMTGSTSARSLARLTNFEMMAFMAGHFGMPANGARAVEVKGKSERRGSGHFRSHDSCRSAFFRGRGFFGFLFCRDAPKIKTTGSGTHHGMVANTTHTSRVRKER